MLSSLVIHADPARHLVLHVLSCDSGEREKENLRHSLLKNRAGLENIDIRWHEPDAAWFRDLTEHSRFTVDAYSRLFAPQILGSTCDRFLYLDCDIVVLADVCPLVDGAEAATVLHAARDFGAPCASSPVGIQDYDRLGIAPDAKVFNSGVLVVNRPRWVQQRVTERSIEYAMQHPRCGADQMPLNACLHDEWTEVDPRWNQSHDLFFYERAKAGGLSKLLWRKCQTESRILHYTGLTKPWQRKDWKPRYDQFFRYLNRTVFAGTLKRGLHLDDFIGRGVYFRVWLVLRFCYRKYRKLRIVLAHPPADAPPISPELT
jgi:lipopolysaccharide biosynthesis glycosyltransferase